MHSKNAHYRQYLAEYVQRALDDYEPVRMIITEFAHVATHGQICDIKDDPVDNWHYEDIKKDPDLYVYKHSEQLAKIVFCTYYVTQINSLVPLTLRAL